jgi:uncharacterized protein
MVSLQIQSMQTRDGCRLDADVYHPEGDGPWPVLLMRQPYGRALASTVVYAHPTWYAAQGYIVVIQDVRGRGSSEGEFRLFETEINDGADAVNWAAQLSGSNGRVGMYGFSYQGMTQLYAAVEQPAALKALCPAMLAYDLYADWAYEGGAFCLQANLGWAIQIAAETARLAGDEAAFLALAQAAKQLPLGDAVPADPDLLRRYAPESFYHDWLQRSAADPYWTKLSPKTYIRQFCHLPMLHIGGWFDPYLRGTLNLHAAMTAHSDQPQPLWVGPWAHLPWGRRAGTEDYGEAAVSPMDAAQVRWFDHWLKDIDTGVTREPGIHWFEMGSNRWRDFAALPITVSKVLNLHTTGLASMVGGKMGNQPPMADRRSQTIGIPDVLVHDPWRPVPALGGHAVGPSGCFDRAALDDRSDVLTYTTEPLTEPLHLAGNGVVELDCRGSTTPSAAPSFDLCAVLSQVQPDGCVYPIAQGYRRVESGESTTPLSITLQATCIQIPAGHALRLSLSGACFPAYPVNPGTGAAAQDARSVSAQIITIEIASDADRPSRVILPVLNTTN